MKYRITNNRSIRIKLNYLFHDYEWIFAYRISEEKMMNIKGKITGFIKINVPKGFWA